KGYCLDPQTRSLDLTNGLIQHDLQNPDAPLSAIGVIVCALQQVTILLQGTRHSEREDIISQLEIILSRLKNGENTGFEHDDDFGYSFQYDAAAVGKSSFFDEAAGRK
ncbi:hypothetical protein ACSLO6_27100, partial [Escherichia coli]